MNQNRNESPLVSSSPSLFFFLRRLLLKSDIVWHQLDKTYNPLVFSLSLLDLVRQVSFFSKHNTQKKNHTGSSNYYSFFYSCRWMDRDQPFHVLYRCTYSAPLPRLLDPPICFRSPGPPYFLFVSLRNPLHCMRPGSPGLFSGKGGGARESLLPAEIGKISVGKIGNRQFIIRLFFQLKDGLFFYNIVFLFIYKRFNTIPASKASRTFSNVKWKNTFQV